MKNTNKYKLNFKTMKKGLLTILAASLVFVGCQNYDDQFDDLNAQISALKSQVDGLQAISAQVASLSGTISGLQSGVTAAQAAATAANTAASNIDFSTINASLAALQADVDSVKASLATAATASEVAALSAELDAIDLSLADLLSSSNVYSTDVTINSAASLESALALGNKLNVLNATLTIDLSSVSSPDYTKVQQVVDNVITVNGNISYTAHANSATEVIFTNLASARDISAKQPGGYQFPALTAAENVTLDETYTSLITTISLPKLASVTSIGGGTIGAQDADELNFSSATTMNLGSLPFSHIADYDFVLKKGGDLNISSLSSKNSSGVYRKFDLLINGGTSYTNGSAAQGWSSLGNSTADTGIHDGTLNISNMATIEIHNFRGATTLGDDVKNVTMRNVTGPFTLSAATELVSFDVTLIRDNDPSISSADATDNTQDNDEVTSNAITFASTSDDIEKIKISGAASDITINGDGANSLTEIDLSGAEMFDLTIDNNDAWVTYTGPDKAEDITITNNGKIGSLNLAHTTRMSDPSDDDAVTVNITNNDDLTSLTLGFDDVDSLTINGNADLATIDGTALTDNGASSSAFVRIDANDFTADLIREQVEDPSASVTTGASSDLGQITTASGIKTLDAYLTHAIAASGDQAVILDNITKLEIQGAYEGTYTDVTINMQTSAPTISGYSSSAFTGDITTEYNDFTEALAYAGYYVYLYNEEDNVAEGQYVTNEIVSHYFPVNFSNNSFADVALATDEGISITAGGTSLGFFQGENLDTDGDGSEDDAIATVTDLVNGLNNRSNAAFETAFTQDGVEIVAARDSYKRAFYTITFVSSTGGTAVAGSVSTAGNLKVEFGDQEDDSTDLDVTAALVAGDSQADVAEAIRAAIDASDEYTATSVTSNSSNVFYVMAHVANSAGLDVSPLAPGFNGGSFPSIVYDLDGSTVSMVRGDTALDLDEARNDGLFQLPTVAPVMRNGMRVSVKNTGNIAFPSASTVTNNTVSGTALASVGGADDADGEMNDFDRGINTPSGSLDGDLDVAGEMIYTYVAAFTEINPGGSVTATKLTNRLGW
jgi:outer membrane murein-binding lipoprotein Lpp